MNDEIDILKTAFYSPNNVVSKLRKKHKHVLELNHKNNILIASKGSNEIETQDIKDFTTLTNSCVSKTDSSAPNLKEDDNM